MDGVLDNLGDELKDDSLDAAKDMKKALEDIKKIIKGEE